MSVQRAGDPQQALITIAGHDQAGPDWTCLSNFDPDLSDQRRTRVDRVQPGCARFGEDPIDAQADQTAVRSELRPHPAIVQNR